MRHNLPFPDTEGYWIINWYGRINVNKIKLINNNLRIIGKKNSWNIAAGGKWTGPFKSLSQACASREMNDILNF